MRKLRIFVTIFVFMFLGLSLIACGGNDTKTPVEENPTEVPTEQPTEQPTQQPTEVPTEQPTEQPGTTVDVSKVTFEDGELEYTGEPLALTVKNLPGGVTVEYIYTNADGEEVEQMIELGEYEITAIIKDKTTKEELRTLTAYLTIKEKEVYDEIPNDANSNIELTYETTFIKFYKDPDDTTRLIAAGLDLYAEETIYFVLDRNTASGAVNEPLQFFSLDPNSVEAATLVDNALVISEQGLYDVLLSFPEDQNKPVLLVREGKDTSVFYFRGTMNDYTISDDYTFTNDASTATFEADLAVGDTFIIGNYYYSVSFEYNPSFVNMNEFTAGGESGSDVKVNIAGHYQFVINLVNKTIKVYRDGNEVIADTNMIYLRGTVTDPAWDSLTLPLAKNNGIASIELDLQANHTFKIANSDWTTIYDYGYFSSAANNFGNDADNNIVVKLAGTYKIDVDTNQNKVTVYYNGNKIVDNAQSSGGNNGGGQTQGSYQIVVNGTDYYNLTYKGQQNVDGVDHEEHMALGVYLNAGDVVTLFDSNNNAHWAITQLNPYSHGNCTASSSGITIGVSGNYDIYVQFAWQNDKIYFGPAGA